MVVETGREVTRVRPGQTVVVSFVPTCGQCFWCLNQESHLCQGALSSAQPRYELEDRTPVGAFLGLGAWAEFMLVDECSAVVISTDLPDDQIALLGCGVTTGVCAVLNTAGVEAGGTVAVIGCGGVGQAIVQGAVLAGASEIIAIDPAPLKLATASRLGATAVVDPLASDPVAAVQTLTCGRGVDYAFEAVGVEETVVQAFKMARRGGTAILVGMPDYHAEMVLPAFQLFSEGKRVVASKYGGAQVRRDIPRLIRLAEAGRLDLGALVTQRVALIDVNDALDAMSDGSAIRSVITW